jgi:hypothetical protein
MIRGPRPAALVAFLALAVAGCGGDDSDDTAGTTTPAATAAPVQPTAADATATPGKKGGKGGKKNGGKGSKDAPDVKNGGKKAVAPELTVLPTVTTNPNLTKVNVSVTSAGVSLNADSLPAGKGMMFNIKADGKYPTRAQLTFTSGGEVVGIARLVPFVVHMETRSLVKGNLEITVSGTNKISQKRKLVPVS